MFFLSSKLSGLFFSPFCVYLVENDEEEEESFRTRLLRCLTTFGIAVFLFFCLMSLSQYRLRQLFQLMAKTYFINRCQFARKLGEKPEKFYHDDSILVLLPFFSSFVLLHD
jgi:hypothetical protein